MDKINTVNRIKILLGAEVLNLEISDETIEELINVAYEKIKPYITDSILLTKPYASVLDLTDDRVEDVLRVYPAESTIITQDKMFDFEGIKLDNRTLKRSIIGSYPIIDYNIAFKFYDGKLYLEYDKVYTGSVTIEGLYTPPLEDLKDEKATGWIFWYALALSKEVCGRIRTKFKSPNVPVEMDGDTMLSEAMTEKQTLEAELQEKQFGPFMILR